MSNIKELDPIKKFYFDNNKFGVDAIAQDVFISTISKKDRGGNIAILILGNNKYAHEYNSVYEEIINRYERKQSNIVSINSKKCSLCSENRYPVGDFIHFAIKGVPGDKEPAGGRKLISYNGDNNPFESYGMTGNENCMICTNCAKTYVEGLNWLLSNGNEMPVSGKKGKAKSKFRYTNRKNFGSDTAIVFWTRNNKAVNEMGAALLRRLSRQFAVMHSAPHLSNDAT